MKNIGMLVAVEMDAVMRRYGQPGEVSELWGFKVLSYQMDTYRMYVVNSGIGEIAAAAATQLLIDRFGVELVVNFGVVGGLTEEMCRTKTCIVEKVVHYDFDCSGIDPVAPGQYPGYADAFLPATAELVERATALQPDLKRVVCASADKFVDGREAKSALHARYGADICEMEAAGVVLTCNRCGVPCMLIKTVSDALDGGGEEFYAQVQRTSLICLELTDKIIRAL